MHKKAFLVILGLAIFSWLFVVTNLAYAQSKNEDNSYFDFSSIGRDNKITGFFRKSSDGEKNKNWHVFIGSDGRLYKMYLIDKNVNSLYVDGQKIPDNQISVHTSGFKPYLDRVLRDAELEEQTDAIESQIESIDRKAKAIDDELEKLDKAEEKLDRLSEKVVANFTSERESIKAQRKRLSAIERDYDKKSDELSKEEDRLDNEQEALGLDRELDKVLERIVADLKSLGVIKNSDNLSFKLSNVELIVNGKRIAPEIYQSLKTKYVPESTNETGFLYLWKGKV